MLINHNFNTPGLNEIFNEANRLLGNETQTAQSLTNTQRINKINTQNEEQNSEILEKNRVTYGLVSLEIMSDEQYKAFERVTANMSHNEKIAVAQILTRAGNLSASVEHIREQEQAVADQNTKSAQGNTQGFLGVTQDGWKEVAKEFQDNLNNLNGIYTKSYKKNLTSNYNDILRKNTEAKTQRILREFSHAIYSGNAQIDMIG
ncbi:hypothetical protein LS70_005260 [Helicobacter sp. MIT 11-5569]|uniref:hypothetical protein n=1 Tax=Helicobacter sp. MIT 11-5569 TaxID=1548151 RepID=UPI00051FEBEA|nr:hypothetical protein [Helicobacter sp. MIT 11-5569]TLD83559.1 hypothetical protein LS70_005260 [Helicobacter sp. MIT 11-5569]